MLVLFETPAGYAFFKLLDENALSKVDNLYHDFETPEAASRIVKLKHFEKFNDTSEALQATTLTVEGKLCKSLRKCIKKHFNELQESLAVADAKLGNAIKDKLNLSCVSNTAVQELMRCIRSQMDSLLAGLPKKEITAMALGLAHSLSRYKLKSSPDKIDIMIVQAICLLDDLDKELNNYVMRCREWYGWHFPELGKIITDNITFVKTVKLIGTRENTADTDLSDTLPEELEDKVKAAAEISMGTEISEDDILNIQYLCDQVIEISEYRTQLFAYLKSRMLTMAPNVTVLVGEILGARLISHAGSLINLAKNAASTIQVFGAEKALFRALKTKKSTPKYGILYHASHVAQSSTKNKGKMARILAAKTALAIRVDAFREDENRNPEFGCHHKEKLDKRLKELEEGNFRRISGTGKAKAKFEKYHSKNQYIKYPDAADTTLTSGKTQHSEIENEKPLIEEINAEEEIKVSKKRKKKEIAENSDETIAEIKIKEEEEEESPKKRKKKEVHGNYGEVNAQDEVEEKPKKKKKKKKDVPENSGEAIAEIEEEESPKKKMKKDVSKNSGEAIAEAEGEMVQKKKKKKKKKTEED